MRLIDADEIVKFYQRYVDKHGCNPNEIRLSISGILFDLQNIPTVNQWIPMSERPPEIGQYVLISTDMNYVATATFQGDYWQSTFDLDWEEILAWKPCPKPYRGGE